MAELGYIGPKPTQFPHGNSGLFSLKDIDELKADNEYTAAEGFILMKYYVSAGGGGGAGGSILHGTGEHAGGQGGAGGLITATDDTSFKLGTNYTITIGAGGAGSAYAGGSGGGTPNGTNGTDTTCTYEGGTYTAVGGGGGGGFSNWYDANYGSAGGSGGGGGPSFNYTALTGGAGTSGQGNAGGSNGDGVYAIGGGGGGYSQAGIAGTQGARDYTAHPFYANTYGRAYLNGGAFPDFGGLYNQDIVGTTINPSGTGVPVNHGGIFFGQVGDDNTGQGGGGTRNGAGAAGGKGYALFVYSKNLTATVGGSLASTTDTVGNNKYTFVTNGTDTISWAVA
tara:strand:+ start:1894 stop:2907 length:1014 start_codon:yes stop_codon:yes gene_type:complete